MIGKDGGYEEEIGKEWLVGWFGVGGFDGDEWRLEGGEMRIVVCLFYVRGFFWVG
jgi:hypothetical protein